jgi:hypothetical protein
MLLTQALATVLLMTRHRSRAAKTLGILGAMMSLGYPGEESVRHAWRHPNLSITALTVLRSYWQCRWPGSVCGDSCDN